MTQEELQDLLAEGGQVLKTRHDHAPILLSKTDSPEKLDQPFKLHAESTCAWAKADDTLGAENLRPRIEPWLTALVQSEHLALLIGSGLTYAIHEIATKKKLSVMSAANFGHFDEKIKAEAQRAAEITGRDSGNFEDQIRSAHELLRGLEILSDNPEDIDSLRAELTKAIQSFTDSILDGEKRLISAESEKREAAFSYLVSFMMSFASRSGTRERLHIFTTNYDRYIEAGADVAGLRLIDRFVGILSPVFRSSRLDIDLHYNPPGIRGEPRYLEGVARFTKLHGSIDWVDCNRTIRRMGLPFGTAGIEPYLVTPELTDADAKRLMIYPNAAKDRETASHPYVELFRDLAAAVCRPNNTLVCYGYSFGDEHINRVIEDMLTIPSTHLVIISYDDPLGRIINTYRSLGRHAQITLLLGNHLGDLQTLVNHYLPKPAIDRTTVRMAELLKARWDAGEGKSETDGDSPATGEGIEP